MKPAINKAIRIIFGVILGSGILWLLFRNTDWGMVYAEIKEANIWWLLLSQTFAWASHFFRIQRWSYVVRARQPVSFRSMFSATQIGFLVNFTIPARLGEVVRAYVLSRLARLPVFQALAMVSLDRINDAIALLLILLISALSFPTDKNIEFGAGMFSPEPFTMSSQLITSTTIAIAILFFVILLFLVIIYLNQSIIIRLINFCITPLSKKFADYFCKLIKNFADGLHIFHSYVDMTKSLFFSLVTWAMYLLSIATILAAFNYDFPWYAPFLILSLVSILISVPLMPGVIGQYHLAFVAGLLITIPSMTLNETKAVAIVAHVLTLIPIAILGIFCLVREKMSYINMLFSFNK
jgi:uncharacterized protein (TIRG00374 family)